MDNDRLFALVRRHAWLVAVMAAIVGLLAAGYAFSRPKEYDATATIQLGVNSAANVYLDGKSATTPDVLSAEGQLVTAPAVQRRVEAAVGLTAPQLREDTVVVARPGLLPGTLQVKVSARSANRAANLANAYAVNFIAERTQSGPLPLQKAAEAIQVRLAEVQRQLDAVTVAGQAPGAEGEVAKARLPAVAALYQSLFTRQQDLLFRITVQGSDAVLVTEALPPGGPARPKPLRNTAVGVIVGLLMGLGAAVLRERVNDKLTDREQIQRELGLPVLAEVPVDRDAVGRPGHLAMRDDAGTLLAESLRTLRSQIQFLGVDAPVRRIVVTSASPGEGKSYVAANLAVAFAQAGFKTTLVSSDLRRPGLDRLFPDVRSADGLSAIIGGNARPRPDPVNGESGGLQLTYPTEVANLTFVPAGEPPPNAGELLAGRTAAAAFDRLASAAEIIIYDSPPLLAVSDGAILATMADGVVLVAVAGKTRRNQLRRAQASLEAANATILGVALNMRKLEGSAYSYSYSYSYGAKPEPRTTRAEEPADRDPSLL